MDPEAPNREKGAFVLNKTKVNEFGFNLSSDNKYLLSNKDSMNSLHAPSKMI